MSRGAHRIDGPFGVWTIRVLEQNRIRLPLELRAVVTWLNAEPGTLPCVGTLGPAGGIQLEPLSEHESIRGAFIDALGGQPARATDADQPWVDVARLLATSWRVALSVESSRISVTLPEPTRSALELPDSGGTVVVFGFGHILEVWHAGKWHDHVRTLTKRKSETIASAIEDLGDR